MSSPTAPGPTSCPSAPPPPPPPRPRVLPLKPLSEEEIQVLILRALRDKFLGIGELNVELSPEVLSHLIAMSNHDARIALNTLALAAQNTPPAADGKRV